MSTANNLREAAITNEQPFGVDWEVMEVFISNNEYRLFSDAADLTHRTFLLIVACALDGGERKPLEGDEFIDMLLDNAEDPASLMREVEEFHGIG